MTKKQVHLRKTKICKRGNHMTKTSVGFFHPGAMGVSLAASAISSGCEALWASEGRSAETAKRAVDNGLTAKTNIADLCESSTIIVSVCPPHAAADVARQVIDRSFNGIYADVNAISPARTREIGKMMEEAGIDFVDGGIIGGPAWKPDSTWLYLSGSSAGQVADCFQNGPLETEIIGHEIGKASALKMCFAANSKGTTALLCAVVAAAENLGVRHELERQWSKNGSSLAEQVRARVTNVTAKAWRFSGEMEEIAATFASAGMPDGFHLAARDVYDRIAGFKNADTPQLDEVLRALAEGGLEET